METMKFLDEYDGYTHRTLDELYMAGMLNDDANKVFIDICSRLEKIENTYLSLYSKKAKTPEEKQLFKKCYESLFVFYRALLFRTSKENIILQYNDLKDDPDLDPLTQIHFDVIKSIVKIILSQEQRTR